MKCQDDGGFGFWHYGMSCVVRLRGLCEPGIDRALVTCQCNGMMWLVSCVLPSSALRFAPCSVTCTCLRAASLRCSVDMRMHMHQRINACAMQ